MCLIRLCNAAATVMLAIPPTADGALPRFPYSFSSFDTGHLRQCYCVL